MDSTWFTVEDQNGQLSIELSPLLAETLDGIRHTPGLVILVGSPPTGQLRDNLGILDGEPGEVALQLNSDSAQQTLYVSCPVTPKMIAESDHRSGEIVGSKYASKSRGGTRGLAEIYARLFKPFADVICVFQSSFCSLDSLSDFLVILITQNAERLRVLPRLVVLANDQDTVESGTIQGLVSQRIEHTREGRAMELIVKCVSEDTRHLRRWRSYSKTMRHLLDQCRISQRAKRLRNLLFNPPHLVSQFNQAYRCMMENTSFDPIIASQISNPVPSEADRQIAHFLSDFRTSETLATFAIPWLVSALYMHAFPPGAHRHNFLDVFDTSYKSIWLRAASAVSLNAESQMILERGVIELANRWAEDGQTAHLRNVAALSSTAESHKMLNKNYCPLCILSRPEFPLPCGHMYCAADIRLMGESVGDNRFVVHRCIVCRVPLKGVSFRFRPSTKGFRALSLDGGGVRGIVLLECLGILESMIRVYLPDTSIIDFFDIMAGTSSGGLCILALAHQGDSISNAITKFVKMSHTVFPKQSIWVRAWNILTSGSIYEPANIADSLNTQFGETTLSDYTGATARAAKIIITTKGTPQGDFILSNYNGAGCDSLRNSYRHVVPQRSANSIKTSDAARVTSAAPGFFSPHTIDNLGTFQDGALWRNNPLDVALSEARVLWPHSSRPDIVLSLGTGFQGKIYPITVAGGKPAARNVEVKSASKAMEGPIGLLKRVLSSYFDSIVMDGEAYYRYLTTEVLPPLVAERCFRMNIDLPMGCPTLDDTSSIPALQREARRQYSAAALQDIIDSLVSTMFYFEITHRPVRHQSHISFKGRVFCDLNPGPQSRRFMETLQAFQAEVLVNGRSIPLSTPSDWVPKEEKYFVEVRGTVISMKAPIEIQLRQNCPGRVATQRISGSPFCLDEIMCHQKWDCPLRRSRKLQTQNRKRKRMSLLDGIRRSVDTRTSKHAKRTSDDRK